MPTLTQVSPIYTCIRACGPLPFQTGHNSSAAGVFVDNHARSGAGDAAELPGAEALEGGDVNAQDGEDDEDDDDDDDENVFRVTNGRQQPLPKKRKSSHKNGRLPDSPAARAVFASAAAAASAATAAARASGTVVVPAPTSIARTSAVAAAEEAAPVDAEAEESDADALMAVLYRDSNATEADKVAAVRKFLEVYPSALDTLLSKMERVNGVWGRSVVLNRFLKVLFGEQQLQSVPELAADLIKALSNKLRKTDGTTNKIGWLHDSQQKVNVRHMY